MNKLCENPTTLPEPFLKLSRHLKSDGEVDDSVGGLTSQRGHPAVLGSLSIRTITASVVLPSPNALFKRYLYK